MVWTVETTSAKNIFYTILYSNIIYAYSGSCYLIILLSYILNALLLHRFRRHNSFDFLLRVSVIPRTTYILQTPIIQKWAVSLCLCAQEVIMRNFRSQLCHWNVLENAILRIGSRSSHFVWISDKACAKNRREIAEWVSRSERVAWVGAHAGEKARGDPRLWFDRPNIFTPPISYTFKKVKRDDAWERERFSDSPVENSWCNFVSAAQLLVFSKERPGHGYFCIMKS